MCHLSDPTEKIATIIWILLFKGLRVIFQLNNDNKWLGFVSGKSGLNLSDLR